MTMVMAFETVVTCETQVAVEVITQQISSPSERLELVKVVVPVATTTPLTSQR
jgi:hypothetical protein